MKKISINILFWKDNNFNNRLDNFKICYKKLNDFKNYIIEKNVDIELHINSFEFGKVKYINESILFKRNRKDYRRSEKINLVLEYNYLNIKPDIFCVIDSDIFFTSKDYDSLIELFKNMQENKFYVPIVNNIHNKNGIDLDNIPEINMITSKRHILGLGAFFVIDFNKLFMIGGFDERFIVWGGEDDDVAMRLLKAGMQRDTLPIKPYHLPHESLTYMISNKLYFEQCKIIGNNDIITRYSIIYEKYLDAYLTV